MAARLAADPHCAALYAISRAGDAGPARAIRVSADITDAGALDAAARRVAADGPVDVLLIATGLLHRGTAIQPEKSWRALSPDGFAEQFAVTASGPAFTLQAFLPHIARRRRALIGVLGARVGSIGDNRLGGWYAYRAAKAALAMLMRCFAIDLARTHPDLVLLMLHPGTVDTPLSQPFQRGVTQLFTPDESAAHLLAVLNRASSAMSGQHRDWRGDRIDP